MNVEIKDIERNHLKELHRWELDEELQVKTGVEVPRTFTQLTHSYEAYFHGEKPNLLLKAIHMDGFIIGKIELFTTEKHNFIGMVIARRRGRGAGSKALSLFLEDLHNDYGINHVSAEVYEDNQGSLNFFERNGFKKTGEKTEEWFRGKPRVLVTLTKELKQIRDL